ncbi:telomere repeats-binding bouquet formation protein 1-like, partial [Saccostrea cucullata]|uniref:telomere repeats-binding bouquet formation protein 1-like n=1 Tax=Saccostrea cuccullata TaxID=36930 RepID=UPI002ED16D12
MDEGRQENEVRTDVKLLLDCLKCQVNNPTAVKQALLTLSSIFSTYDFVKEYFKDIGGLTFLIDLLTSIENHEVQERAFFCLGCAIERNVFCQKSVTTSTVFKFIQTILSEGSTAKLKQTATFFLINLVANNGEGQVLVKQSQCLSTLMDLLCKSLPKGMRAEGRDETGFDWFDDSGPTSIELWTSVVNALCVSINNPQNEENQKVCGLQIPFIFKLLKQDRGILSLTRSLMFLLGFIVSNNRSNQDQVRRCGGLGVLCQELQHQYNQSNDPEMLKDVIQIITTIDSCIADNNESAKELGQTGVIQILASVIHDDKLDIGEKIKVTITLGHAIEHSASNRSLFLEAKNGLQDLIHILTTCENEELMKAIKYVLQVTVQKDTILEEEEEEEWNQEMANKKIIGENILKKVNELANRLKSIEKEKDLSGNHPTMIHTPKYNKNFNECPTTQDCLYTQPTL